MGGGIRQTDGQQTMDKKTTICGQNDNMRKAKDSCLFSSQTVVQCLSLTVVSCLFDCCQLSFRLLSIKIKRYGIKL